MALIPDVSPGDAVAVDWGNGIRNRTIQTFANETALLTWTPADGIFAWNTANKRLYLRVNSLWVRQGYTRGGTFNATTNASGEFNITHGGSEMPTWINANPAASTPNLGVLQVVTRTVATFTLRCLSKSNGALLPRQTVTGYWSCGWV